MLSSESCVWKWNGIGAPPSESPLTTGSQLVPSGWMPRMPQPVLCFPCVSSELKMMRPSFRTTGCSACPTFRWPIFSTLAPSSSITNSWSEYCAPRGALRPSRLLTKHTRPPGSGHGCMLSTCSLDIAVFTSGTPVFGVRTCAVSRVVLRVLTFTL